MAKLNHILAQIQNMPDVNLVVSENVALADDTITLPVCTLPHWP
jgi:uncharacterized spore protein YtfJ